MTRPRPNGEIIKDLGVAPKFPTSSSGPFPCLLVLGQAAALEEG